MGAPVTSLDRLAALAGDRRSVCLHKFGVVHVPAEVVMNMTGATILSWIRAGLEEYIQIRNRGRLATKAEGESHGFTANGKG